MTEYKKNIDRILLPEERRNRKPDDQIICLIYPDIRGRYIEGS